MNLTKKRKKKGFTLIELMAVIAIIAILAAVLVPTVSGYINRSKKTAIITQVRNVVSAVEAYNATAIGSDTIKDTEKISNLVGNDGKLQKAELLASKDIDRLKSMTVAQAVEINLDTQALDNIKVDKDGTILSYNNTTIASDSTGGNSQTGEPEGSQGVE